MSTTTWTPRLQPRREGELYPSRLGLRWARRLAIAAGLVVPTGSAWCFDPHTIFAVGAGPVVLHPKFDVAATYSDNIYSLPDDSSLTELGVINSRDDIAFILSPSFNARLGRPEGDNRVDFDFRFDQYLYSSNPDADSGNYTFGLSAVVKGAKLTYDCSNSLKYLNSILDAYTSVLDGIPVPAANVERIYVDLNHQFAYALSPKTRLLAGGRFSLRDYPGGELTTRRYYNSEDWRANGGVGYSLSEKISLDTSIHYGQTSRDPTSGAATRPPRADFFGGTVGARGAFTPKLSGGVRAGYEQRWFSDDAGDDGYPIAGVDLSQRFTEKTTATLGYNRGGGVSATAFSTSVTVSDSFFLNFQQVLGYARPWVLNLGVRYAQTDYVSGDTPKTDNFQVDFGARYQIREWLSAFANYAYQFGSRTTYDYDANQVTLGFHLGY